MPSTLYKEIPRGFYGIFVVSESATFVPGALETAVLLTIIPSTDEGRVLAALSAELEAFLPKEEELPTSTNVNPFVRSALTKDGTTLLLCGPTDDMIGRTTTFMWSFAQAKGLRLFAVGVGEPLPPGLANHYKGAGPDIRLSDLPPDVLHFLRTGKTDHMAPERRPRPFPTLAPGKEIDYEEVVE